MVHRNSPGEKVKIMLDKKDAPCYNTQALGECSMNIAE